MYGTLQKKRLSCATELLEPGVVYIENADQGRFFNVYDLKEIMRAEVDRPFGMAYIYGHVYRQNHIGYDPVVDLNPFR